MREMTLNAPKIAAPPRPLAAVGEILLVMGAGALLLAFRPGEVGDGGLLARLLVPGRILLLCLLAAYLLRRRREAWSVIGLAPPDSIRRVALLVIGGYLATALLAGLLLGLVFPALGLSQDTTQALAALRGDPWAYVYWLTIAWTSAAIGEEILFRGFLTTRLMQAFGGARWAPAAALVAQAAIFGVSHGYQGLSGILLTGATGLVLGLVYLAGRRNLIPCILLHGLIDTISLTAIFLGAIPGD